MFDNILNMLNKITDVVSDVTDMAAQLGGLLKNFDLASLGSLLGDIGGLVSLIPGAQPIGAALSAADMLTDVVSSIDLD